MANNKATNSKATKDKTTKDKGPMMFIVVVLLLTLVGAGTGFAVGSLIQSGVENEAMTAGVDAAKPETVEKPEKKSKDAHGAPAVGDGSGEAQDQNAEEEVVEVIDPHSLKTVPFPPVLTTLAEPKGKWIRLEGSILTTNETEDAPEILAERSGEQILAYLRSLRLDQLEGPANVLGLREDLTEMLQVLSNGQVKGILINGLVVE
jgi:flagellar protein FliL